MMHGFRGADKFELWDVKKIFEKLPPFWTNDSEVPRMFENESGPDRLNLLGLGWPDIERVKTAIGGYWWNYPGPSRLHMAGCVLGIWNEKLRLWGKKRESKFTAVPPVHEKWMLEEHPSIFPPAEDFDLSLLNEFGVPKKPPNEVHESNFEDWGGPAPEDVEWHSCWTENSTAGE